MKRVADTEEADKADAIWVLLLLLLSGNPAVNAVFGGGELVLSVAAVLLLLVVMSRNLSLSSTRFAYVTLALTAIQLVQASELGFFPVTILGSITRLLIGACIVVLVGDFTRAYIRAMVAIATYALVMYAIDQVTLRMGGGFRDLFAPLEQLIGIDGDHHFTLVYTFTELEGTYRNAAFFREPGLFAGYLLFAILFVVLRASDLERSQVRQYLLVLVLALASTFSTAGYVTLPFVLAAVAVRQQSGRLTRLPRKRILVIVLAVCLGALWLINESSEFLEEKIAHQYEQFLDEGRGHEITRFGSALLDIEAIEERPITGWGLHESTKYALTPELAELSPSGGVTGWARSFGLAGLAVLVIAVWSGLRSFGRLSSIGRLYITFVVILIAQPNTFLNFPLFMALLFLRDSTRLTQLGDEVVAASERVAQSREQVIDAGAVSNS